MAENPYAAPKEPMSEHRPQLTVTRGLITVGLSALAFAILGGLLGLALGLLAPDYYRSVFPRGDDPNFVPWLVGLGLGISQGAICGVIAGVGVVFALAWYHSRREKLLG